MARKKKTGLAGHLLISTEEAADSLFGKSVIFLCSHDEEGALGLIINRPVESVTYLELLSQFHIKPPSTFQHKSVYFGGAVEVNRGFILHTKNLKNKFSLSVGRHIALSATVDFFRELKEEDASEEMIVAMGYAGWGPGQLEDEIRQGAWLHTEATSRLIFKTNNDDKWGKAIDKIGLSGAYISLYTGNA